MENILIAMCLISLIPFYTLFIARFVPKNRPPARKSPKGGGAGGLSPNEIIKDWWDGHLNQREYKDYHTVTRGRGQAC